MGHHSGGRKPAQLQTLAAQQTALLFDHLVGASKKQLRDGEAQHLGGLEVYNQLDFRGTGRSAGFSPLRMRPA